MATHTMLYRNPNPRHHADFADAVQAADGSVHMLLRQCGQWAHDATYKFGRPLTFFEADAEIRLLRSDDGGRSFVPRSGPPLFRGLAFDPFITRLRDKRLVAGAIVGQAGPRQDRPRLRGVLHRHLPQLDTVITLHGVALWFSADHGRTWTDAPVLANVPDFRDLYNARKPVELDDGTLLLPLAIGYPWRSRHVALVRSWDGGETWSDGSIVADDPSGRFHYDAGPGYWEPGMALQPAGELTCVSVLDDPAAATAATFAGENRATLGRALPLIISLSFDSGFTWTQPHPLEFEGDFPALATLRDGRILLVWTHRQAGSTRLQASVSTDGGRHWGAAHTLFSESGHSLHYPNPVLHDDDTVTVVAMESGPDLVRFVSGTRFPITDVSGPGTGDR